MRTAVDTYKGEDLSSYRNSPIEGPLRDQLLGYLKEFQSSLLVLGTKLTSMPVDQLLRRMAQEGVSLGGFRFHS